MKVALLTPRYFPEVRRGTERVVRDVAAQLHARGHAPRIVTTRKGRLTRTVEDGVEVLRLPRPRGEERLRRQAFVDHLLSAPGAYVALATGDDDLAHAFFATDGVAATRWAADRGRPAVVSWNGVANRPMLAARRLSIEVIERSVLAADAVIVPSHAAAAQMERWVGVEAHVIHPGVDLGVFAPGAERAAAPTVLCAADAADDRKRVGLLLEAWPLVRREHPDAVLQLVRPRDAVRAERLTGLDGVELLEPADDPGEMARRYGAAWVSALAAYDEAFGLVLAEALACGTPVAGRRHMGIPEIVGDAPVGALFEGDEPADCARALLEALELAGQSATAAACRERAAVFSTVEAGARHEALYRGLLAA